MPTIKPKKEGLRETHVTDPASIVTAKLRDSKCNIYYEKSVTKNLGNYESAKVTVGVTLPVSPSVEEIAVITETIELADEIVTRELKIQLEELIEGK